MVLLGPPVLADAGESEYVRARMSGARAGEYINALVVPGSDDLFGFRVRDSNYDGIMLESVARKCPG
jgi:hypothetical protein